MTIKASSCMRKHLDGFVKNDFERFVPGVSEKKGIMAE